MTNIFNGFLKWPKQSEIDEAVERIKEQYMDSLPKNYVNNMKNFVTPSLPSTSVQSEEDVATSRLLDVLTERTVKGELEWRVVFNPYACFKSKGEIEVAVDERCLTLMDITCQDLSDSNIQKLINLRGIIDEKLTENARILKRKESVKNAEKINEFLAQIEE